MQMSLNTHEQRHERRKNILINAHQYDGWEFSSMHKVGSDLRTQPIVKVEIAQWVLPGEFSVVLPYHG